MLNQPSPHPTLNLQPLPCLVCTSPDNPYPVICYSPMPHRPTLTSQPLPFVHASPNNPDLSIALALCLNNPHPSTLTPHPSTLTLTLPYIHQPTLTILTPSSAITLCLTNQPSPLTNPISSTLSLPYIH
jgi:hypothetical protein